MPPGGAGGIFLFYRSSNIRQMSSTITPIRTDSMKLTKCSAMSAHLLPAVNSVIGNNHYTTDPSNGVFFIFLRFFESTKFDMGQKMCDPLMCLTPGLSAARITPYVPRTSTGTGDGWRDVNCAKKTHNVRQILIKLYLTVRLICGTL